MANRFQFPQKGTLSAAQERALVNLITTMGRDRFSQYRRALGIHTPIPRLSRRDAWRLINLISQDTKGGAV